MENKPKYRRSTRHLSHQARDLSEVTSEDVFSNSVSADEADETRLFTLKPEIPEEQGISRFSNESASGSSDYDMDYRFERPTRGEKKGVHTARARGGVSVSSYGFLLFVSILVSFSFYSFPFFMRLSDSRAQSTALYSGFAMSHHAMPYNNFYASDGPLFYLANQIGALGGTSLLFWIFEILALFFSSVFILKTVASVTETENQKVASVVASFAILAIAGISMGGESGIILGLPFALYGVRLLTDYMADSKRHRDEAFILYGIAGAAASLFAPIFLSIWVIGFLALIGCNIRWQLMARGFYQFLASLFGFLLIYAVVGYYTLSAGIFTAVLEQAVIVPFRHFLFNTTGFVHLGMTLGLLLLYGLITSWLTGFRFVGLSTHKIWTSTLLILSALVMAVSAFRADFVTADALAALPLLFIFSGMRLAERADSEIIETRRGTVGLFLRHTLALPVFGLLFLLAFPVANTIFHANLFASEKSAASYVKENTSASQEVFVFGADENINLLSKRTSSLDYPPSYMPKENQLAFDTHISEATAKLIVVEKGKTQPASLKAILKTGYTQTSFKDNNFTIYAKKK
ncbi:MAG: hypothetical protein LBI11_05535 [Streptococcaceae bacterium]|jgi:MFS family permease|nr:hypothetical protein [Streptococcaceae bacterium]